MFAEACLFLQLISREDPDLIVLQEIKLSDAVLAEYEGKLRDLVPGHAFHFSLANGEKVIVVCVCVCVRERERVLMCVVSFTSVVLLSAVPREMAACLLCVIGTALHPCLTHVLDVHDTSPEP